MNRGSIDNKKNNLGSKLDYLVDRFNQQLSRILGKNPNGDNKHKIKKIGRLTFIIIIFGSILLIWSVTGIYYIRDNQAAIIINYGKVARVEYGEHLGMVMPYPFSKIEILNRVVSESVNVEIDPNKSSRLDYLTSDLQQVAIKSSFQFKVTDPKKLYIGYMQENSESALNNKIKYHVGAGLHHVVAQIDSAKLKTTANNNLAIQVKNQTNNNLRSYGVEIIKIDILSVDFIYQSEGKKDISILPEHEARESLLNNNLANDLLQQAYDYQKREIANAHKNSRDFNQLLPEYKESELAVVEYIYKEALEQILQKSSYNYSLLNLSLKDLLDLNKKLNKTQDQSLNGFDRIINRERDFGRHVER